MHPQFPSKILLFGEYGIIHGSQALTIPTNMYRGQIAFSDPVKKNPAAIISNQQINEYLRLLRTEKSTEFLKTREMEKDISQGLYFKSNIPTGYGLGSSGALVAALYDRYHMNDTSLNDLKSLRAVLAALESPFHGKSSGLDPLVSYLKKSILSKGKGELEIIDFMSHDLVNNQVFLIDTGIARNTRHLIYLFHEKMKDKTYKKKIYHDFFKATEDCIQSLITGKKDLNKKSLTRLSGLELSLFREMIPEEWHEIWYNSLLNDDFRIKLCGAGGGGFLLGFTENFELLVKKMSHISHFFQKVS
ncbi:MAG: mevalonate kinase [Bacteroidota bacterium]